MKCLKDTNALLHITLQQSRKCGRQVHRANPITDIDDDYFKITVYLPFLDVMLTQLQLRFNDKKVAIFDILIPTAGEGMVAQ